VFEQGAVTDLTLTYSCISDLFSYAQKLWITLWMNHLDGCCNPSTVGLYGQSLKKYAATKYFKNKAIL
jgi:hypothetical protein